MTFVDVKFLLKKDDIIFGDYGYYLYSALSTIVPVIHGNKSIGIFPITKKEFVGNKQIKTTMGSSLIIRCPVTIYSSLLDLVGQELRIGTSFIHIYNTMPKISELVGTSSVYSELVFIKFRKVNEINENSFIVSVNRQLERLYISGNTELRCKEGEKPKENKKGSTSTYIRRGFTNKQNKNMYGYALYVHGLSNEDSIKLQIKGLGGARHFGCGMFRPLQEY